MDIHTLAALMVVVIAVLAVVKAFSAFYSIFAFLFGALDDQQLLAIEGSCTI